MLFDIALLRLSFQRKIIHERQQEVGIAGMIRVVLNFLFNQT